MSQRFDKGPDEKSRQAKLVNRLNKKLKEKKSTTEFGTSMHAKALEQLTQKLKEKTLPSNNEEDLDLCFDNSNTLKPYPFRVGPALQVLSVAIFRPDNLESRLHGEITITDQNMKKKHFIYKGDKDKIDRGWNDLFLTSCPIAPVMGGSIEFQLKYKGQKIFYDAYNLNAATENSKDRTFTLKCDGNFGYRCKIVFTKTPYATIVRVVDMSVKLPFCTTRGIENDYVHGKITVNKVVCFETNRNDALKGKYNTKINFPISRTVYAVPIDSSLTVEVELYSEWLPVAKKTYVLGASFGTVERAFKCDFLGYWFHIELQWMIPYNFFEFDVKLMVLPDAPLVSKRFGPPVPGALVEVFSVVFCGGNSSAPRDIDLFGTVAIRNGDEKVNILHGNKDSSKHDEQEFRTLSLKWPNDMWVEGNNFNLQLKLKDVNNNPVCMCITSWMSVMDARYDIRLCDVFKSDKGYLVGMHYSVFKNAKKAKVSVEFSKGPLGNNQETSIYGTVYAQYSNYDYSSTYEKQCYRSILFKRSKEDALLVTSCQLPLLKSQVSAPQDCEKLVVHAELWVRPLGETPFIPVRFAVNTDVTESCAMVYGCLTVKVDWV